MKTFLFQKNLPEKEWYNERNQLTNGKKYRFDKPLFHKIFSINDNCIRDCRNKYFRTFEYKGVNDINLTNINKNEIFNLTIADKSSKLELVQQKN